MISRSGMYVHCTMQIRAKWLLIAGEKSRLVHVFTNSMDGQRLPQQMASFLCNDNSLQGERNLFDRSSYGQRFSIDVENCREREQQEIQKADQISKAIH